MLRSLLQDPASLRIAIVIVAAILVVVGYFIYRLRETPKPSHKPASGLVRLGLDQETSPAEGAVSEEGPAPSVEPRPAVEAPHFATVPVRHSLFADLMRVALIILAFVVAAGLVVTVVPQGAIDRMAQSLRSRSSAAPLQEKVALLFLGDEIKGNEFHVRGAVRNITPQPLESLDAMIRLYAPGGSLLETAIVRMDKESIAPDEVTQFHLVYPDYKGQIGSYSVEFKLRQGDLVPYKDMRGSRSHS